MKHIYLLSVSVALLAACGGNTADQTADTGTDSSMANEDVTAVPADDMSAKDTASAATAMPADAAGYAAMAGASDMFEIESSKAAMAKSSNAEIDKFAQMMVDHHTQSTTKVKAAAKTADIT